MATTARRYTVTAPAVPGAQSSVQARCRTISDARGVAKVFGERSDLAYQDVRIERTDNGALVEYAGPAR